MSFAREQWVCGSQRAVNDVALRAPQHATTGITSCSPHVVCTRRASFRLMERSPGQLDGLPAGRGGDRNHFLLPAPADLWIRAHPVPGGCERV